MRPHVTPRGNVIGPKFSLGMLVATPGAMEATTPSERELALRRHMSGDWGEVCDEDKETNDSSVRDGSRILSAYTAKSSGEKFWIITEADRFSTTILLPEDY